MGLSPHIIGISEVHRLDEELVGKKGHEIGMLWKLGILLPDGFVTTTQFHKQFLHLTGIDKEIRKTQALKHPALSDSVNKLFYPVQKKIIQTHIPHILISELHNYYKHLSGIFKDSSLNVFSSSLSNKSIIFPNVKGDANLILKIKTIWSEFPEEVVAIVIQKNISSKIKGKIFTDNPTIDKKLTEEQMNKLSNYCKIIQKHFYFPKEIEYAVKKGKLFITNVNPFTGTVDKSSNPIVQNNKIRKVLSKGIAINPGIVTGPVKILNNKYSVTEIKMGDVVVLQNLDHSLFKNIRNAKGLIVDSALSSSLEKALIRQYFKIPIIEVAKDAKKVLHNGNVVTVNGMTGEIYSGGLIY